MEASLYCVDVSVIAIVLFTAHFVSANGAYSGRTVVIFHPPHTHSFPYPSVVPYLYQSVHISIHPSIPLSINSFIQTFIHSPSIYPYFYPLIFQPSIFPPMFHLCIVYTYPFLIQSIRSPIHSYFIPPFVHLSIPISIHSFAYPFLFQSIRSPIHSYCNPFVHLSIPISIHSFRHIILRF